MSLKRTHAEYVIEKVHKEYLYEGTILTSDELEDAVEEYQKTYTELDKPTSNYIDFTVERGESASASLMEQIKNAINDDVTIASREIYNVAFKAQRFFDRWSMEMNRLELKAAKLEQRIDSLLLLSQDTLGFFAYVGDTFRDMNLIDTENTTTSINLIENSVSINQDNSSSKDSSGGSLIDLSHLNENDISFEPISSNKNTTYFTTNRDNALVKLFHSQNSQWVGKVSASENKSMICELKANVGKTTELEVSRVSIDYKGSNSSNKGTVTLQYSLDGYSWFLVPTENATISLSNKLTWKFPLTKLRWIKFIFYKTDADNTNNEYVYSATSIKIFGEQYNTDQNDILISKSLTAIDKEQNNISFSKAALLTCDEVPDNTSIKYYLSGSKDNSIWTEWAPIAPSNYEGITLPKIINFSGIDYKDNTDDTVTKIDSTSSLTQQQITDIFDDSFVGYKFKNTTFGVVNTAIEVNTGEDPNIIANNISLWRNIRVKDEYPDVLTVRDTLRGWKLEGGNYSCFFEVINSNGIVIDFGKYKCQLNDQEVSGVVNIPQGIHKFVTKSEYWYDIGDALLEESSTVINEETINAIDPLYPYNHKLLIEGIPYDNSFKGEKKYKGTDMSAEYYCKRVSLFDLENNTNELNVFAVRSIGDANNPTLGAIVKVDTKYSDYSNELCLLKWRSGSSNSDMYKYIKLRAILSTSDSGYAPTLSSYRIKLGF